MSQSNSSNPRQAGLKAERTEVAIVVAPKEINRLKAERIQLGLVSLPGWTLQRGGITRTFELADKREVARLLQYVAELAFDGEMPELHVRREQVTFVLPLIDDAYLDKPLFEMAQSLAAGN
jgi:pterin-4a-carbinolamine dehydratase